MKEIFSFVNKEEFSFLDKHEFEISNMQENIELAIYSMVSFFAPFFLAHPQILVGVVVNAALVLGALNLRGKKLLPIIILPSLGVISAGIVFGTLTPFLVYMVPFIWIANAILVFSIKKLVFHNKMNKLKALGIGAIVKSVFLFAVAFAFVNFSLLPTIFLSVMGIMQIVTALSGGVLALGIHKIRVMTIA